MTNPRLKEVELPAPPGWQRGAARRRTSLVWSGETSRLAEMPDIILSYIPIPAEIW